FVGTQVSCFHLIVTIQVFAPLNRIRRSAAGYGKFYFPIANTIYLVAAKVSFLSFHHKGANTANSYTSFFGAAILICYCKAILSSTQSFSVESAHTIPVPADLIMYFSRQRRAAA